MTLHEGCDRSYQLRKRCAESDECKSNYSLRNAKFLCDECTVIDEQVRAYRNKSCAYDQKKNRFAHRHIFFMFFLFRFFRSRIVLHLTYCDEHISQEDHQHQKTERSGEGSQYVSSKCVQCKCHKEKDDRCLHGLSVD